ncbi:hypothetical protein [Sphingomonas sp. TWP1-3-1]|uniref:hypothetical protein n=1 Tax=Sphingomonas sp. TWP1-3-1 TaxID=2804612 RepID=UPI003CE8997D
MKSTQNEWIPARIALASLVEVINPTDAVATLRTRLADGIISARAQVARGLGVAADAEALPTRFWRFIESERWDVGDFSAHVNRETWSAYDTELERLGVETLISRLRNTDDEVPLRASAMSAAGRPRSTKWEDWIAALALMAANGKISGSMTETKLLSDVNATLAEMDIEELPRATVQKAAVRVLQMFREEGI